MDLSILQNDSLVESPYTAIQLLLLLVEIAQSSHPPLRFAVFPLVQQSINKMERLLDNSFSVNSLPSFQHCLDLLQLTYGSNLFIYLLKFLIYRDVLEKAGICTSFKRTVLREMNGLSLCQQSLLRMLSQATSSDQKMMNEQIEQIDMIASVLRILLLSAYLLHRAGLGSVLSIEDAIDLTITYVFLHSHHSHHF